LKFDAKVLLFRDVCKKLYLKNTFFKQLTFCNLYFSCFEKQTHQPFELVRWGHFEPQN